MLAIILIVSSSIVQASVSYMNIFLDTSIKITMTDSLPSDSLARYLTNLNVSVFYNATVDLFFVCNT